MSIDTSHFVQDPNLAHDIAIKFNDAVDDLAKSKNLPKKPAIYTEQASQTNVLDKIQKRLEDADSKSFDETFPDEAKKRDEDLIDTSMLSAEMEARSQKDALTEINNRRGFDSKLESYIKEIKRSGASTGLAVVLFDIINYKGLNDNLGYEKGDEVLQFLAQTLTDEVRQSDTVARYGGDEFVVILPTNSIETANKIVYESRHVGSGDNQTEKDGILAEANEKMKALVVEEYRKKGIGLPERLPGQMRTIILYYDSDRIKGSRSAEALIESINSDIKFQYEGIKEAGR